MLSFPAFSDILGPALQHSNLAGQLGPPLQAWPQWSSTTNCMENRVLWQLGAWTRLYS